MSTESPKWIAMVISLVAITISSLSWWESHRGRLINEEVNRPILVVTKDDLSTYVGEKVFRIDPGILVKNNGKVTANVEYVRIDPFIESKTEACRESKDTEGEMVIDLLPGAQESIANTTLFLAPECKDTRLDIFAHVLIAYHDPLTGKQYFQQFQFSYVFDPQKKAKS